MAKAQSASAQIVARIRPLSGRFAKSLIGQKQTSTPVMGENQVTGSRVGPLRNRRGFALGKRAASYEFGDVFDRVRRHPVEHLPLVEIHLVGPCCPFSYAR